MIRVQLPDRTERRRLALFLTFANLKVKDDGVDSLLIDFEAFNLDESAQLHIVNRMLMAWETIHQHEIRATIAPR